MTRLVTDSKKQLRIPWIRSSVVLLGGQGLTFATLILSVVFANAEQLQLIVPSSALVMILLQASTCAYSRLYLSADDKLDVVSTLAAVVGLAVTCGVLAVIGVALDLNGVNTGEIAWLSSLQLASQGSYFVTRAWLMRSGDLVRYAYHRVVYGLAAISTMSIAVFLTEWAPAASLSTSAAFLVAAFFCALSTPRDKRPSLRGLQPRGHEIFGYWVRNRRAALASLVSDLGGPLISLAVALAGGTSQLWAIVLRLAGGMATVITQVVAPTFEIRISTALRQGHRSETATAVRSAMIVGAGASIGSALAVGAALFVLRGLDRANFTLEDAALTIVFVVFFLGGAAFTNVPLILHAHRLQLAWSLPRGVVSLVLLSVVRGPALMESLALVEAISCLAFYAVCAAAVRHVISPQR